MSDICIGLTPGDNPKVVIKQADPDPPEGFVDNTVKVYKLNPDGSKGEYLRNIPAFPQDRTVFNPILNLEGHVKNFEETVKGEDAMPKVREDREEKLQQAKELMKNGKTMNQAAITLGVPVGTLGSWFKQEEKKQQTPNLDLVQAANQEPDQGNSGEPAGNSINLETEINPPFTTERLETLGKVQSENDDKPINYLPVEENTFDLDRFKVRLINAIREQACLDDAPDCITLDMIYAVIDVNYLEPEAM